jgi:hypothetical protein
MVSSFRQTGARAFGPPEKKQSREDDARALASSEKSAEQLRRENGSLRLPQRARQPPRGEAARVTHLA